MRDYGNGAKNRETCEINRFLPPEDGATNGMELNGKVILITGASSGIGRAVALALSHGHNDLVITARRTELLNDLAKAVESNGSRCAVLAGDALLEERAEEVVREAVVRFGRIDAALLNIGAGPPMNTATVSPEVIKGNMRLNYDSMINYFYPLLRQMKSQGAGGLIAHTNSLAGFFGLPMQGPYSAAKAACRIFLDTARTEGEEKGRMPEFHTNNRKGERTMAKLPGPITRFAAVLAFLLSPALTGIGFGSPAPNHEPTAFHRPLDPVVLEARSVKTLLGVEIANLWVYGFRDGSFRPAPFQIDEVTEEDSFVYNHGLKPNPEEGNGILDPRDMICMRAEDAGARGPDDTASWPEGADRRVVLKLVDPINGAEGFLSLFHFPQGLPSFSVPPPGEMLADNPITITSDFYKIITTGLGGDKSTLAWTRYFIWPPNGGTGINILDRMRAEMRIRAMFGAVKFTINEQNLTGQTVAWRLEGIRGLGKCWMSVKLPLGLKGPKVWVNAICYERIVVVPTQIHVPFNPGTVLTDTRTTVGFDLNKDAFGMLFFNSNNGDGMLIDGRTSPMEEKMDPAPDKWRLVAGPQGTLMTMSVWDKDYQEQADLRIVYTDDREAKGYTGDIPGLVGGHFTQSTVKKLEPRSYGLVLFFISPPNVYREDTTIDIKTVEEFLNFRFQPIQVVTPSGEFKNLAPYPPYHLPK